MKRFFSLPMRRVAMVWPPHHRLICCSYRLCRTKPTVGNSVSGALGAPSKEVLSKPDDAQKMMEMFQGLSESDQELILNALQHPEEQKNSKMGGAGIGTKSGDMVAAFTCGRCDYRTVKKFSKHAYTKGIVIVQCPSCEVQHLLADNLGWFVDEARNIEDILREKGDSFVRIGSDYQAEPPKDQEGSPAKE